jgi:CheY-like chemotaxis protein
MDRSSAFLTQDDHVFSRCSCYSGHEVLHHATSGQRLPMNDTSIFGQYHVHIVEDEAINRQILREILKDSRYKLSESCNGEQCLEFVRSSQPDIILLDIKMPGIDGFETCKRLKAMDICKQIPVIFLTSVENPTEIQKGVDMGAEDYILKPYKPSVVKGRVYSALEGTKVKIKRGALTNIPDSMPI